MKAWTPRIAVRRTPPAKVRPRSTEPAKTTFLFAISTDPNVDERDGLREIETVHEIERY